MSKKDLGYDGVFQNSNVDESLFYESSFKSLDKHRVNIFWYADPLCCSCWALDPIIKRLLLEYGDYFNLVIKMGGLLESWKSLDDPNFSSRDQMADHWREVGDLYEMPISGKVWTITDMDSSYPASMAYIAAKNQGDLNSLTFWRKLREAVFIYDKDISDEYTLASLASDSGLSTERFLKDFHSEKTKNIFFSEISETKSIGVEFLPTMVFLGENNESHTIEGVRPYETYVFVLKEILGYLPEKNSLKSNIMDLFEEYSLLSFKEIAYLTDLKNGDIHEQLEQLISQDYIETVKVNNSCYWKKV